jgi:hypothetical protein
MQAIHDATYQRAIDLIEETHTLLVISPDSEKRSISCSNKSFHRRITAFQLINSTNCFIYAILHACAEACAAIPEHVIAQMARAKPQIT